MIFAYESLDIQTWLSGRKNSNSLEEVRESHCSVCKLNFSERLCCLFQFYLFEGAEDFVTETLRRKNLSSNRVQISDVPTFNRIILSACRHCVVRVCNLYL